MKKLNLEELIARKNQSEADREQLKVIEVERLGFALMFKKLPMGRYLEICGDMDYNNGPDVIEKMIQLIYESCPALHDKQLLEGLAEPYDVVGLIFNDNIGAITDVGKEINASFYGLGEIEKTKKNLKN